MVLYRGQCQVHRAEVMQFRGAWPDALDAAVEARERFAAAGSDLARPAPRSTSRASSTGCAVTWTAAEAAFREASRRGHLPQPGLALLRLAQGQVDAARRRSAAARSPRPTTASAGCGCWPRTSRSC